MIEYKGIGLTLKICKRNIKFYLRKMLNLKFAIKI